MLATDSNPFSTRWIRPGALPYLWERDETTLCGLAESLLRSAGWGQILGPHGAGKSTLLHALVELLRERGWQVAAYRITPEHRRLPLDPFHSIPVTGDPGHVSAGPRLVVVDGYEQLSIWGASWLRTVCRVRGAGLLVTTHRPVRLPLLWRCEPTVKLAVRLAERLQQETIPRVAESDVRAAFGRCAGNLRETWFTLYDLYEHRRRVGDSLPCAD